jgi:hypothetical protein
MILKIECLNSNKITSHSDFTGKEEEHKAIFCS